MIKEPQKPEKPDYLDSLEIFYLDRFRFFYKIDKMQLLRSLQTGKPTCYVCGGFCKVKDTTQRCPVEGLKDADLIPCPVCVRGVMPMEYVLECYKDEVAHYKEKVVKYKRDLAIYESIMSKLTPEEIEYVTKS